MSYEVREGRLWETFDSDDPDFDMGPLTRHVTYALDVLEAAWGPDAVKTEWRDRPGAPTGYGIQDKCTVVRSPWRKVDG